MYTRNFSKEVSSLNDEFMVFMLGNRTLMIEHFAETDSYDLNLYDFMDESRDYKTLCEQVDRYTLDSFIIDLAKKYANLSKCVRFAYAGLDELEYDLVEYSLIREYVKGHTSK